MKIDKSPITCSVLLLIIAISPELSIVRKVNLVLLLKNIKSDSLLSRSNISIHGCDAEHDGPRGNVMNSDLGNWNNWVKYKFIRFFSKIINQEKR